LKVKVVPFIHTSIKVKAPKNFYLSTVTRYFGFVTAQHWKSSEESSTSVRIA